MVEQNHALMPPTASVILTGAIVPRAGPDENAHPGDAAADSDSFPPRALQAAIGAIRQHLGMHVAYVSKFDGDYSVFQAVDAPGLEHLIKAGDSRHLDDVYCRHILAGRLPELIPDTRLEPLAMAMPITGATPIGSHLSVPVRDKDGMAIGMFCCLSPVANPSLNARDLQVMRVFADIIGDQMARKVEAEREVRSLAELIDTVIAEKALTSVYQPIFNLATMRPAGVEGLSRFTAMPYRSPDLWFADAFAAGRGIDLELAAIEVALRPLSRLPPSIYLSVNASARTIVSGRLESALADMPLDRIVLELTEHEVVADYDALLGALGPLRRGGIRIAVDDAGAGFASLQHILRLGPDRIKLDMSLTRDIDSDPARRALASAMVTFARETGAYLIAEGIETRAELEVLMAIGVDKGQGYLLGRPASLDATIDLLQQAPARTH